MKQKKHSRKKGASPDDVLSERPAPGLPPLKLSKRQLWLGRLFIAIFIPLLLLGALEVGLRIAKVGYPTRFFLPVEIARRLFYVTNEKFGYRFFPPALARTPLPLRMAADKPANEYRIFLFGESAAQGDPDPSFGAGRYLEVLLRERYPGMDFQVVCAAMTAINSHAILPIARECAGHQGDLWIVYMGNNEMVGPFGAGTVFGQRAPSLAAVRTVLALKKTKIGQMIEESARKSRKAAATPQAWSGMNMFRDHQLRYDDANRLRTYENFRGNLVDILRAGRSAGVPVVLSTVGSNLKDCAPFASLHALKLTNAQKTEWDNYFGEGTAFETNQDYPSALSVYAKAAALDPEFAELQFRMGRCQLALTNATQALHGFEMARDYDALAFRADTRINQIIKDAANADKNVTLVDAATILDHASPNGISGQELFYEHVHLDFEGNYLLARAFADAVEKSLPPAIAAKKKGSWASEEMCERSLAVSPWDRCRLWEMNYSRVSEPPFTEQLNDAARARMYMAKLNELRGSLTGAAADNSRAMYAAAVKATPEDTLLHENFSQFLDGIGDLPHAIDEQKLACELLPCFPAPFYKTGLLQMRAGNDSAAATCFSNALALRDDYVPALNELALIKANSGRTNEAEILFARALKLNPGYVDTYFNFGFVEQMEGRLDDAIAQYQTAAKIQPDGPAVYFSQAVIEDAQHHRDNAINYFHAAVTMFPIFWQAHYLLGVEFAAQNKIDDAAGEFMAVVRSRPDFARGHLYLGVAFARQGKLDDAMKEFQTVLRLDPGNELVKQYIGQVNAAKAQNKGG